MTPTLDEILASIEGRANKAEIGPWRQIGSNIIDCRKLPVAHCYGEALNHRLVRNSHFIANARTDIPALIRLAKVLRRQREMWKRVAVEKRKFMTQTMEEAMSEFENRDDAEAAKAFEGER